MIEKIDHIGIAVKDLDAAVEIYRDQLGLKLVHMEVVEDQKVRVAMFEVGDLHIELLEPVSEDSPISGFLEKRGQGLHHLCYKVEDVDQELADMRERGVRTIDSSSRPGAEGKRVAFLHPKSTCSVLTELNSTKKEG